MLLRSEPKGASVEVVQTKGGWSLHRDGVPYDIKGVGGGESDLDRVRASGASTIRTWGIGIGTGALLDAAHAEGLSVLVGLWMGHIGDGFDYNDSNAVAAQEAELVALAEPLKSHPALPRSSKHLGGEPGLSVAPGADRVGFYAWSDPPSDATFRVGGGNNGFATRRTFSRGTEPAWYELPIDPDGDTDVTTGFEILANGQTPRTISVSTPTWIAASSTLCPGDLNGDGIIGPSDLGLLLGAWNEPASSFPEGDLSGNGTIDAADLGLLIGRWAPATRAEHPFEHHR